MATNSTTTAPCPPVDTEELAAKRAYRRRQKQQFYSGVYKRRELMRFVRILEVCSDWHESMSDERDSFLDELFGTEIWVRFCSAIARIDCTRDSDRALRSSKFGDSFSKVAMRDADESAQRRREMRQQALTRLHADYASEHPGEALTDPCKVWRWRPRTESEAKRSMVPVHRTMLRLVRQPSRDAERLSFIDETLVFLGRTVGQRQPTHDRPGDNLIAAAQRKIAQDKCEHNNSYLYVYACNKCGWESPRLADW